MPIISSQGSNLTQLMDLPVEVLIDIFSRLPATLQLQFRCVSRTLRDLINSLELVTQHTRRQIHNQETPQVRALGSPKYSDELQFVYSGLLGILISHYHRRPSNLFLYDPMRSELLRIPIEYLPGEYLGFCGMGFDAITGSHKLLGVHSLDWVVDSDSSSQVVARVQILGTNSWRRIPSVPPCRDTKGLCLYYHGSMHWLVDHKHCSCGMKQNWILCFDVEKEEFGWTPHPEFPSDVSPGCLVNRRGSINLINYISNETKVEIWILRNYREKMWTKDYTIDLPRYCIRSFGCGAWEHGIALAHEEPSPYYQRTCMV